MDRTPRGHGRTKYMQSKYAETSVYEEVDETLSPDTGYDDGIGSGKGAIYRTRKRMYKRFSPYERKTRDSDRPWTHDKFDENEDNDRFDDYNDRRVEGGRRERRERREDRWEHDKYDESGAKGKEDKRREHRHVHSRKRSSSRSMERGESGEEAEEDTGMSSEGEKAGEIRGYKVSVSGLSGGISNISGLTKVFSKWGKITDCGVGRDGKSGYVVYDDKEAAKDAVTFVNKTEYNGKKLVVSHDGLLIN